MCEERMETAEIDLPPEFCQYKDDGCEVGRSCLCCSLPVCVLDEPGGQRRWLKKKRNSEIVRLAGRGKSVKELARGFGLSTRTIQRTLRQAAGIEASSNIKEAE